MGTRNLTMVKKNGDYKIAQYGQWDGYPSGQGVIALDFLRNKLNKEKFFLRLEQVFDPTEQQTKEWIIEAGGKPDSDYWEVGEAASNKYFEAHPALSRNMGAEILSYIQDDSIGPTPTYYNLEFVADSLFCEWAYVIDFDTNTFEVYKGFNQYSLKEGDRFFAWTEKANSNKYNNNKYQPIVLVKSYDLDNLPTEEEFLEYFNKE